MKKGYKINIENVTKENFHFRRVLYTGQHLQLVLMTLKPNEEIGLEVHEENDQFFRFESGFGKVIINETEYHVEDGDTIIVPAGSKHNVINVSEHEHLNLYTIYAPPHHKDGIERFTKEDAETHEADFDGILTEE